MNYSHIIGVDEAGRGPLAGPVCVGLVAVPKGFNRRLLRDIKDSKKLSERRREEWYERLREFAPRHGVAYTSCLSGNEFVDQKGIMRAIRAGLARGLRRLSLDPERTRVLLDGSLYAPDEYIFQKTIIRGEESEPLIALASIVAKVRRDRKMKRLSRLYPEYDFAQHKGYGTRAHYKAIRRHGICPIHRTSYVKM
jgi:ribonuclease HII